MVILSKPLSNFSSFTWHMWKRWTEYALSLLSFVAAHETAEVGSDPLHVEYQYEKSIDRIKEFISGNYDEISSQF